MSTAMQASRTLASVVVTALLALPSAASAQVSAASELPTTARMMGLGGNAQALAQSTSGVYSNPGGLSLARVYHVDSTILYDPTVNRWGFGGTVADSTRTVGAALSYNYSLLAGSDVRDNHDVRLALSVGLTEGVALGVTGRYMSYGGTANTNSALGSAFSGFTLDVGAVVRPAQFLTLAVTGYSLTNPDTARTPLSVGGGVAITPTEALNLVVDNVWDLRSFGEPRMRLSGGAEVMLGHVPVRAGYLFDDTRAGGPVHTLTAGLGYVDTSFALEAALRQDVAGNSQTTMMLNVRYFYRNL